MCDQTQQFMNNDTKQQNRFNHIHQNNKNEKQIQIYDLIIIGAGLSGLSTGYYLKKKQPNISILIIEAKNRVGGRTQSAEILSSSGIKRKWDVGGQWVCDTQTNIKNLLNELDIKEFPQYNKGKLVIENEGKVVKSNAKLLNNSIENLIDLNSVSTKLSIVSGYISTKDPYLNEELAIKLDKLTYEQYLHKLSSNNRLYSLINAFTRNLNALEPCEINALYASMFIKSAGGNLNALLAAEGANVQGGTQQISEKLLKFICEYGNLNNSMAIFNCPVSEINQECDDYVEIKVFNTNKNIDEIFYAKKIVSSIPPNQYSSIKFKPDLPIYKKNVFNSLKAGNYIKYIITYKNAFWRDKDLAGYALSDGSIYEDMNNTGIKYGPLSEIFDCTNQYNEPALVCFSGGQPAYDWSRVDAQLRKNEVIKCLVRYFGIEANDYIEYYEKNWNLEPYNGGCPTFNMIGTNIMKDYSRATREPFIRIHFCGTESATQWQGYMDGAIESGIRVANELYTDYKENNFNKSYRVTKENINRSNL